MSGRPSPRAETAWTDFLALGDGRSLEKLAEKYRSRTTSVPTRQLSRLKRWSADHGWQGRLKRLIEEQGRAVAEDLAARRREVLEDGFALDYERVRVLKRLAGVLLDDLEREVNNRRWVQDVKAIGAGTSAERVDIERFNASEVSELRGLLDDIAKEVGGRQQRIVIQREAERIASELGLDAADVLAEAERLVGSRRG